MAIVRGIIAQWRRTEQKNVHPRDNELVHRNDYAVGPAAAGYLGVCPHTGSVSTVNALVLKCIASLLVVSHVAANAEPVANVNRDANKAPSDGQL